MAPPPVPEAWMAERLEALGHDWHGLPRRAKAIAVGVDGGRPSLDAVEWAALLTEEVHLVHGLGMYDLPRGRYLAPDVAEAWAERTRRAAKVAIAESYELLRGKRVRDHTSNEPPARAILRVAFDVDADAVAVGNAGRGTLDRLLLGSVSEALAHRAELPALVAKAAPGPGPILVGLGEDDGTPYAASWAAAIANWLERDLIVAHAVPDGHVVEGFDALGEHHRTRLATWPPRKGLAELAERAGAALVVVGHGHRPGWLGSNAIGLVRKAPCSVLVTRPWVQNG